MCALNASDFTSEPDASYLCDPAFNGSMRESGKQLPLLDAAGSIEKEYVARCLGASASECQEGNRHGNGTRSAR